MKKLTFHLIGSAHLDPVWLWDWREGLNEGIITVRTILDLMDEFEELTFVRGESAVYRHIEEHDPKTFARIVKQIENGRWDVVGGTFIQPDGNMPATETFARHFARGQNYFISRFGRPARVAWLPDSFGHCIGLPEIMAASGIEGFVFTRPTPDAFPIAKSAFWWEGPGKSRVLCYRPAVGWYGAERDEIPKRLDATLETASKSDIENVAVFFGLGNHGGGPVRRQIRDIAQWAAAHPDVKVVYSGLHRLIDSISAEARRKGAGFLPTVNRELNFTLRGCYASVAKFKFAYRRTEAALASAERTETAIRSALKQRMSDNGAAWDAVLFNSFHDLLPGTSIERGYDDQFAWLGSACHHARRIEVGALNALGLRVDTSVDAPPENHPSKVPVLAWNPHPWPFKGHIEWEANLDYRMIHPYAGRVNEVPLEALGPDGKPVPFQVVANECALDGWNVPWRKRVVAPVELPPLGWKIFQFGWVEGAKTAASPGPHCSGKAGTIDNGIYRVQARKGDRFVKILRKGKPIFVRGGLSAVVVEDKGGSWGGSVKADNLSEVIENWKITRIETVETGPERAKLWLRFSGRRSWIELTFCVYRGRDAVDVTARVLFNERWARLKLAMPVGVRSAEFDVPGARVVRKAFGEVPGGQWVRAKGRTGSFGFASDALYCFDCHKGDFRVSVARASGYASSGAKAMAQWRPAVDCGELKFNFLMSSGGPDLPFMAQALEQPPVTLLAPAKKSAMPRSGSFASLRPTSLQLLALKGAEDGKGLVLRVQETAGRACNAAFAWLGHGIGLGKVAANTIATWRIERRRGKWAAKRTSTIED